MPSERPSSVEWHMQEGETFEPIKRVATVTGKARFLLLGERIALNLLARCSGIATKSANFPISRISLADILQVQEIQRYCPLERI